MKGFLWNRRFEDREEMRGFLCRRIEGLSGVAVGVAVELW